MASRLRSQPWKVVSRRVHLLRDGEVVGETTWGKVQESIVAREALAFDVGDGVRPSTAVCEHCGRAFDANTQGKLARVCLAGCDRSCKECGRLVTLKSARAFATQGRRPVCRRCADLGRPKITHCKRGHELTEANTLLSPKTGQRFCRTCKRERMRKARARG